MIYLIYQKRWSPVYLLFSFLTSMEGESPTHELKQRVMGLSLIRLTWVGFMLILGLRMRSASLQIHYWDWENINFPKEDWGVNIRGKEDQILGRQKQQLSHKQACCRLLPHQKLIQVVIHIVHDKYKANGCSYTFVD